MYKTEVRQIAKLIGIPEAIIAKPPSAGLWEGQTDECDMGITYADLDSILYGMENGLSDSKISVETGISLDEVTNIHKRVVSMEHKRMPALRPSDF